MMSTPVQRNQRPEVDPTLTQSSLQKVVPQHRPPFQNDKLEMHDSAVCSWISSAFWYAIDCINAIYDWVVLAGWNLLAWIGIVNPPAAAAPNRPEEFAFLQRAQLVRQGFAAKSPFEQVNILREVSCDWASQLNERQSLLNELKDMASEKLRDALIDHAATAFPRNEVNARNIAQYLDQMNEESCNTFLKDNFAQHVVEALTLGWYMDDGMEGGKPPAQEAHFVALGWITTAEAHEDFEPHIDDEWFNARFATAKSKLTQSDRDVLLRAYNIRNAQDLDQTVGVYLAADHMGAAKALLAKQSGYTAEVQGASTRSLEEFYGQLGESVQAQIRQDFYKQNEEIRDEWKQRFDGWLREVARKDAGFGEVLDIAMHQLPQVVKRDCETILAKQDEGDNLLQGLFASNPGWTQRFLDTFITPQVAALMVAQKVGEIDPRIDEVLAEQWEVHERAQQEESYTGIKYDDQEAFNGAKHAEVARDVEQAFREQYKSELIQAGWVVGEDIYDKLQTTHVPEEDIHAAIRTSMPL